MKGQDSERFLFIFPGFLEQHPELEKLTDGEYREWMGILFRQLRYGYTYDVFHSNGKVSGRRIRRFLELGLLADREGVLHISKWEEWSGRKEHKRMLNRERQKRWYQRQKLSRETKT